MNEIIEGSKLIAEYLGWVYVASNDLRGFPRAGWYETKPRNKTKQIEKESEISVDVQVFEDSLHRKIGWEIVGENYVKFVCRNYNQLRFYNSVDSLIPAIEKLEKEDLSEFHYKWTEHEPDEENGEKIEHNNFMNIEFNRYWNISYYDINLELDPPYTIGEHRGEGIVKDTFHATVSAIKHINNLRDES